MSGETIGENAVPKREAILRRLKRLGGAFLATVALIPLNDYQEVRIDPAAYSRIVPLDMHPGSPVKTSLDDVCDNPSYAELDKVRAIFSRPENPQIANILKDHEPASERFAKMRKEVADKYDLTVYDFDSEFPEFKSDMDIRNGAKLPFSEYFEKTKEFALRYGVDISLKDPNSPEGRIETVGYDPEDLETTAAKLGMYQLALALSAVPVEYVTYMDVKKVIIAHVQDSRYSGYADTDEGHTMYMDPQQTPSDFFYHESTHLWDSHKCGREGARSDSAYTEHNPQEPIYDFVPSGKAAPAVASGKYIDFSTFESFKSDTEYQIRLANDRHDREAIKELRRLIIERGLAVAALRAYSFTNELEDKADTGGALPDTFAQRNVLNPLTPILRDKAELLLGRMYKDHPRLVYYFSEVAMRP